MELPQVSTEEGITIKCSDDKYVTLNKKALYILSIFSAPIKVLVMGKFKEAHESQIRLPGVNSTVFRYLFRLTLSVARLYKKVSLEALSALLINEREGIINKFVERLESITLTSKQFRELSLPLLMAADFFDISLLVEALCRFIGKNITYKEFLEIPNGLGISEELSQRIVSIFYAHNPSLHITSHNTVYLDTPSHTIRLDGYKNKKSDEVKLQEGILSNNTFLASLEIVSESGDLWRYVVCDLKNQEKDILLQHRTKKRAWVKYRDLCQDGSQALCIVEQQSYNYCGAGQCLIVWNAVTGKPIQTFENRACECAYFISNTDILIVNHDNACVIDIQTGTTSSSFNFTLSSKECTKKKHYYDFNKQEGVLAVMFPEHIEVWNVKRKMRLCSLQHKIPYYIYDNHLGIVLSPCGTKLLFGTSTSDLSYKLGRCCVALWNIITSMQIAYFEQCFASCAVESPYFLLSRTLSDDYKIEGLYNFNGEQIKRITKHNGECITSNNPPSLSTCGAYFLIQEPHLIGKWIQGEDSEELDATLYTIDGHPTVSIVDPTFNNFERGLRRITFYSNQQESVCILSNEEKIRLYTLSHSFKPKSWQQMVLLAHLHHIALCNKFVDLSNISEEDYRQKCQQETDIVHHIHSLLKLLMSFDKPIIQDLIKRYKIKVPQWVVKKLE